MKMITENEKITEKLKILTKTITVCHLYKKKKHCKWQMHSG